MKAFYLNGTDTREEKKVALIMSEEELDNLMWALKIAHLVAETLGTSDKEADA